GGGISCAISRSGVTLGCRSTRWATPPDPFMHAPYRRAAILRMPDNGAGIQLTVLEATGSPIDSADDVRLIGFYTYPDDLRSCWVRGNMIASLDGGATADCKSGGLAGRGDRAVFSQMRHAADVILVGASTVRVENYSGAQLPVA